MTIDSGGNAGIATTKTVPRPPVITNVRIATATSTRRITRINAQVGNLYLTTTTNPHQPIGRSRRLRYLKIISTPSPITRPIVIDSAGNPGMLGDGVAVDEVTNGVAELTEVPVNITVSTTACVIV